MMRFLLNRPWMKNLFFSLGAVFLFFSLLESALHLSGYQARIKFQSFELPDWFAEFDPVILEEYKKHVVNQGFVNEDVYAYRSDEVLGYLLQPDIRKTVRNYSSNFLVDKMPEWTLISNAAGFRIGDASPVSREQGRVHVLGDSSSFGWGVEFEETYGSVFTEHLNASRRKDKGTYRLLNHSMPGFSSLQGRNLLQRLDDILPGDWVLISFGWNDSYYSSETDRIRQEHRQSAFGRLRAFFKRFLFYRGLESFLIGNLEVHEGVPNAGQRVPVNEYKKNLTAMVADVKSRGANPVLLSICNFDVYPEAIRSVATKMSVPFFDFPNQVRPLLSQVPERFGEQLADYYDAYGEWMEKDQNFIVLFPDYCHPNRIGHRLLGDVVFDVLHLKMSS